MRETEELLTVEEAKTSRISLELNQLKMELEKRLAEKDDESNAEHKNLLNQAESLHQQLESETKMKNDLVKAKKLVESEVVGLQDGLDAAETTIFTLNGNLAKQQKCIIKLQKDLEISDMNGESLKHVMRDYEEKLESVTFQKTDIEATLEKTKRTVKSIDNEKIKLQLQYTTLEHSVSLIMQSTP